MLNPNTCECYLVSASFDRKGSSKYVVVSLHCTLPGPSYLNKLYFATQPSAFLQRFLHFKIKLLITKITNVNSKHFCPHATYKLNEILDERHGNQMSQITNPS
jgi:hypothetical protein